MRSNFIWFAFMSFKCKLLRSFYPSVIGSKKGVSFPAHVSTFSYHVMKAGQLQKTESIFRGLDWFAYPASLRPHVWSTKEMETFL